MFRQGEAKGGGTDWRELILVLAALFMVGGAPSRRFLDTAWEQWLGGEPPSPSAWTSLDLSWREEGGEGVVLALEAEPAAIGGPVAVDPRLALFTYRAIDLNRADVEVLQTVRGIGPKLAGAIVGYREKQGPFRRLDDLLLVSGIGPAKLANLRRRLVAFHAENPGVGSQDSE